MIRFSLNKKKKRFGEAWAMMESTASEQQLKKTHREHSRKSNGRYRPSSEFHRLPRNKEKKEREKKCVKHRHAQAYLSKCAGDWYPLIYDERERSRYIEAIRDLARVC